MSDGMSLVGLNGFDCEMASGAVPAAVRKLRQEEVIKKSRQKEIQQALNNLDVAQIVLQDL
jgi:hypothetical protein